MQYFFRFLICLLVVISFCLRSAFSEETPEWVKRIELSTEYETDKKPTLYFQTVQPFHQSIDKTHTFFYQPRVSLRGERFTYNLGLGYRTLTDDNLLLGLNVFGDYEDLHEHGRAGMGLEVLGERAEARINGYFGVTSKRVITDTGSSTTYERVADGVDVEFGKPLPALPWIKVYASGFFYNFSKFDDKRGWKTRVEAKLNDMLLLEFYTWDDNKGDQEYGGRLSINIAFDSLSDFKDAFKFSDEPFSAKALEKLTLAPVERDFDITVEKWTESAGFVVEVGRN